MKEITKDLSVAEYINIRQYVIKTLYGAKCGSKRLASTRELAKMFSVSRPTVLKALHGLIEDGFLIVKPGLGTFVNPDKFWTSAKEDMVGLLIGDGNFTYFDTYFWDLYSCIGNAIRRHCFVQPVQLTQKKEYLYNELQLLGVKALIWIKPCGFSNSVLEELECKLPYPVLFIDSSASVRHQINFDTKGEGAQVARRLIEEKRFNPVIIRESQTSDHQLEGFRETFAAASFQLNPQFIMERSWSLKENLRKMLDFGITPSAVYFCSGIDLEVLKLLEEQKIDIKRQCRLITNRDNWFGKFPGGWKISYPQELLAKNCNLFLEAVLSGRPPENSRTVIQCSIEQV